MGRAWRLSHICPTFNDLSGFGAEWRTFFSRRALTAIPCAVTKNDAAEYADRTVKLGPRRPDNCPAKDFDPY